MSNYLWGNIYIYLKNRRLALSVQSFKVMERDVYVQRNWLLYITFYFHRIFNNIRKNIEVIETKNLNYLTTPGRKTKTKNIINTEKYIFIYEYTRFFV